MTEKKEQIPECASKCMKTGYMCTKLNCRMWIDYPEDQNCSLEKQALNKLSKRIKI